MVRRYFLRVLFFICSIQSFAQYKQAQTMYEQSLAYLEQDTILREHTRAEGCVQKFSPFLLWSSHRCPLGMFAGAIKKKGYAHYQEGEFAEVEDSLNKIENGIGYTLDAPSFEPLGKDAVKMRAYLSSPYASKPPNTAVWLSRTMYHTHNGEKYAYIKAVVTPMCYPADAPPTKASDMQDYAYWIHALAYWFIFKGDKMEKVYVSFIR
jgi:hypothetical protein